MTHNLAQAGVLATTFIMAGAAAAQPQAELTVGTRSVASVGAELAAGPNAVDRALGIIDFSDTSLLLRGRLQLFPDFRGGSVLGLQFPDADSDLGVVFFHQAYVFVESRNLDIKVGRSRVQSSLIEFPTLRDDDLLPFTDVLNPFATGATTEDHQYANVLELTGNLASKYFLAAHAEHMFLTPGDQGSVDFTINSLGTSFYYRNIPDRIDTEVLREAGAGFNYYDAKDDGRAATWNLIAAGALNLYPDPIHLFEVRAQGIYNHGDAEAQLSDANTTFRARSVRGAAALRYLFSDGMIPTMQVAIVAGYARYVEDGSANSWSGTLNGFYSLGYGFDVGVQYQLRRNSGQIREALGTPDLVHTPQAVLRFGYELTVNPLPNRDSILNVEHDYIP